MSHVDGELESCHQNRFNDKNILSLHIYLWWSEVPGTTIVSDTSGWGTHLAESLHWSPEMANTKSCSQWGQKQSQQRATEMSLKTQTELRSLYFLFPQCQCFLVGFWVFAWNKFCGYFHSLSHNIKYVT